MTTVEVRCPNCRRFLCEIVDYGRARCRDCGWEVEVRSPRVRKQVDKYPIGG